MGAIEIVAFLAFSLLLPVAIVAAIAFAVSRRRSRGGAAAGGEPIAVSVRRFYFYLVALVGLLVGVGGAYYIVGFALEALVGERVIASSREPLAIGLSLAIVGLAVWAVHWRQIQRSRARPAEANALLRSLYVYLVLAIAGAFLLVVGYEIVRWLLGIGSGAPIETSSWSFAIVWGVVWVYHWRVGSDAPAAPPALAVRRLYIYGAAAVALIVGAAGLGMAIFAVLDAGYHAVFGSAGLLAPGERLWDETMISGLALAISGLAAWSLHWLGFGAGAESALRQAYAYAAALLGGYLVAMVAVIALARLPLGWLLGGPPVPAAEHFAAAPNWIATFAVGAAVWLYHRAVLRGEADRSPLGARAAARAYTYPLAGFGLAAVALAVGIAGEQLLESLLRSDDGILTGAGAGADAIATSIALALAGTPVFLGYWRLAQRRAGAPDGAEQSAPARKIFVFGILGITALTLIGSLSFLLYALLSDVLEGEFGIRFLYEGRGGVAAIAATLPVLLYYWAVYRRDREREPVRARVRRREVAVLLAPGGDAALAELEQALGYGVEAFAWADAAGPVGALGPDQVRDLAERVAGAAGARVLVTLDSSGARVLSYDP